MSAITGPISTLPGFTQDAPKGEVCDDHPGVAAVVRIQGETDSWGAEMHDLCQACADEMRAEIKVEREKERYCNWCKHKKSDVRPYRDTDEGFYGPVYQVCFDCRAQDRKRLREEDEYESRYLQN